MPNIYANFISELYMIVEINRKLKAEKALERTIAFQDRYFPLRDNESWRDNLIVKSGKITYNYDDIPRDYGFKLKESQTATTEIPMLINFVLLEKYASNYNYRVGIKHPHERVDEAEFEILCFCEAILDDKYLDDIKESLKKARDVYYEKGYQTWIYEAKLAVIQNVPTESFVNMSKRTFLAEIENFHEIVYISKEMGHDFEKRYKMDNAIKMLKDSYRNRTKKSMREDFYLF